MKKVVITGGNRGIGRAIVMKYAADQCEIVFSYSTSQDTAEATCKEAAALSGQKCRFIQADFRKSGEAERFVREAIEELGGIDILVNNAAITKTHRDILDMDEDFAQMIMQTNFISPIVTMHVAGEYMARNGIAGTIINISSVRGQDNIAWPHDSMYGSAKAGLDRAIQSIALTFSQYGIRVNNVAPGATKNKTREELIAAGVPMEDIEFTEDFATNKIPLGRQGRPEDIANAVHFLTSDEASYITGITLRVDGGLCLPGMPERRRAEGEEDKGWGYIRKRYGKEEE